MNRVLRYAPIALLAGTALTATACASSYYGPSRRAPYGYRGDVQRIAYDNGYREGLDHGEKDGRRGRPYSVERNDEFRDADKGYRRGYGDRDYYRRVFRDGFARGYREGYGRNARGRYDDRGYGYDPRATDPYGGSYPVPRGGNYPVGPGNINLSPAGRVGYEDGYRIGRDDAQDGKRYDPTRADEWRDGDHRYDRRYGSKNQFRAEYRSAFEQGYAQGYRESRR